MGKPAAESRTGVHIRERCGNWSIWEKHKVFLCAKDRIQWWPKSKQVSQMPRERPDTEMLTDSRLETFRAASHLLKTNYMPSVKLNYSMGKLHVHQWNTYFPGHSLHLYKVWFKEQWNMRCTTNHWQSIYFSFYYPDPHSTIVFWAWCGCSTQETNKLGLCKVFILFIIEIWSAPIWSWYLLIWREIKTIDHFNYFKII